MNPLALALVFGAGGLLVAWLIATRRDAAARRLALKEQWGQWRDAPRRMDAIARYFRARSGSAVPTSSLDDRTWQDLTMDDVFRYLDRTSSLIGQQMLYVRLRASPVGPHMAAFEALVSLFEQDAPAREHAGMALAKLDGVDADDLWTLVQPGSFERERWHVVFPIFGATMFATAVLAVLHPPFVLLLVAGTIGSIALRATAAPRLQLAAAAFRQVGPLLAGAGRLRQIHRGATAAITAPLADDLRSLARLGRVASWVGRNPANAASGDVGALAIEYLNHVFCLDGTAFYFGAAELKARRQELLRVAEAVGEIDAAVSIASYRAGTPVWTRPRLRAEGSATRFDAVRHPLIPGAVPNTLALGPPNGVVVTGSNMSGKSTFLRTIGVTTVMAQTINTCVTTAYEAPVRTVRSCIGRADDPAAGKSYYLVEVEAVLDLVRAAASGPPMLLLFDELFHGTNTVERLAAGESVVRELLSSRVAGARPAHVVVAATHDQELVEMLGDVCQSFHFSDDVGEAGLTFDYVLHPGPATSRNAIELLRIKGAPAELIARAMAAANAIDASRRRLDISGHVTP